MLTPMMVQYLVGLCCLQHDPEAINIILGDMVYDSAANKKRDVDVTITINDASGIIAAFKAAEVKAEGKPLDVADVEQLCMKFSDMPDITHKSIFSSSGYTDGAQNKAKVHSVDLYTLMPSDKPIGEVGALISSYGSKLLYWENHRHTLTIPSNSKQLDFAPDTPVFNGSGKEHKKYPNMEAFINGTMMRSTEILCTQEPAMTILQTFMFGPSLHCSDFLVGPIWPHTHTLDVTGDKVFLMIENKLSRIDGVTISGDLQWRSRMINPEFFVLRNVFDQKVFAGVTIASHSVDNESMWAMVYTESKHEIGIHPIIIPEKHRNIIRMLKIK